MIAYVITNPEEGWDCVLMVTTNFSKILEYFEWPEGITTVDDLDGYLFRIDNPCIVHSILTDE